MSISFANLYFKNSRDFKIINKFKPIASFRFIDDILYSLTAQRLFTMILKVMSIPNQMILN